MVVGETEQTIREEMDWIIAGKHAAWEIDTIHRTTWTGEKITYHPLHPAWNQFTAPFVKGFYRAMETTSFPREFGYWVSHQCGGVSVKAINHRLDPRAAAMPMRNVGQSIVEACRCIEFDKL
jgi:hypothetical protein